MGVIRQGDVCLARVKAIPKDAIEQPQRGKKLILALGEATGHHHRFEFLDTSHNVKLYVGAGGARYLDVSALASFCTRSIRPPRSQPANICSRSRWSTGRKSLFEWLTDGRENHSSHPQAGRALPRVGEEVDRARSIHAAR